MSCYGCAKKYNFFNKEKGCPNCGFSFCSSCLKFKMIIPKLGRSEHLVCRSCHAALTDVNAKSLLPDHPAAYIQRLESLENPSRAPITVYKHDQRMEKLKTGLTQTDKELADRLEKLREGRINKKEPLPSEDEIAKRLALLKGQNPASGSSSYQSAKNLPLVKDTRTQQQQADDLLLQYTEEHALSSKHPSAIVEITRRLAVLRGQDVKENVDAMAPPSSDLGKLTDDTGQNMSLSEANTLLAELRQEKCDMKSVENDVKKCLEEIRSKIMKKHRRTNEDPEHSQSGSDNEDADCVIKRVLDEADLEEKLALSEIDLNEDVGSDTEELPWCVICNEDAKRRCEDCDGDLFCDSCFKEGHKDIDTKEHHSVAYKPIKESA